RASSHQLSSFGIASRWTSESRKAFIAASLSQDVRVQNTIQPSAKTAPPRKPSETAACAEIAREARAKAGSENTERRRNRVIELNAIGSPLPSARAFGHPWNNHDAIALSVPPGTFCSP